MNAKKFDLVARSAIIRSEKPNKGLEAVAAPNPNQMNRVVGYFTDGTKVIVAQRPGKGGMDFNKIMGGKVYAVAADSISPVYEKDEKGNPTKKIKHEDGMPLYSSSGFYLLSSKEYPALSLFGAYTKLIERGAQVLVVSPDQLKDTAHVPLESELDLEMLTSAIQDMLDPSHNCMASFDADSNKRRKRGIERAQQEAEDAEEAYQGVQFKELAVSKKDGNPFVLVSVKLNGQMHSETVLREKEIVNEDYDDGRTYVKYLTPEEAVELFVQSKLYKQVESAVSEGSVVEAWVTQGHLLRTSVSFRRKVENVLAQDPNKPVYGDAVYIQGALKSWCKGLVNTMHSMHPNFPTADYEAHHYVAAVRQAEVGMTKKPDGSGWTPPQIVEYDFAALQQQGAKTPVTA